MIQIVIANCIFILVEEEFRNEDNDANKAWLYIDFVFVVAFTIEFFLYFVDQLMRYFGDTLNVFDFILVVMGIIGLVVNIMAMTEAETPTPMQDSNVKLDNVSADGRVVRVARVFRVLRLIRLLRLWRYWSVLKARLTHKEESLQIREHMQKICILQCFVRAHSASQKELVQYFGTHDQVDNVEVARCILQSQCSVYKAVSMAVAEEQNLEPKLLHEVNQVRESKFIAEELEGFVLDAHHGGVINAREAESILRPLHDHMKKCMKQIQQTVNELRRLEEHSMGEETSMATYDNPSESCAHEETPVEAKSPVVIEKPEKPAEDAPPEPTSASGACGTSGSTLSSASDIKAPPRPEAQRPPSTPPMMSHVADPMMNQVSPRSALSASLQSAPAPDFQPPGAVVDKTVTVT